MNWVARFLKSQIRAIGIQYGCAAAMAFAGIPLVSLIMVIGALATPDLLDEERRVMWQRGLAAGVGWMFMVLVIAVWLRMRARMKASESNE